MYIYVYTCVYIYIYDIHMCIYIYIHLFVYLLFHLLFVSLLVYVSSSHVRTLLKVLLRPYVVLNMLQISQIARSL